MSMLYVHMLSLYIGEDKQGVLAVANKNSVNEFENTCKEFKRWVAKQSLPIEAAITTITGAVPGAVMGAIVDVLFEATCSAVSIESPTYGVTIKPEVYIFTFIYISC